MFSSFAPMIFDKKVIFPLIKLNVNFKKKKKFSTRN